MDKEAIIKMRDRAQKKAQRYYDDFQNGASSQYYSHYRTNQDIAWLCDVALSGADDRKDAAYLKNMFAEVFELACRARYNNNLDGYRELCTRVYEIGKIELDMKSKYE